MIDDAVSELLPSFQDFWKEKFSGYRWYRLDGSWPSVGIIDLILTPLRNKFDFKEPDLVQLQGCACYLGAIAHDCWCLISPNVDIQLSVDPQERFEIVLRAMEPESKLLLQEVRITSALISILQNAKGTLAFFKGVNIPVDEKSDLISKFAIGLFTGLTPWGVGKWSELNWSEEKESLRLIEQFLADTSSFYFSSVKNPEAAENPIIESEDLYLAKLIVPPAGVKEITYGAFALQGLMKKLSEFSDKKSDVRNCLQILSRSPSSQMRLAASALMLGDETLSVNHSSLHAAVESHTELLKLLELSEFARKLKNKEPSSTPGQSKNDYIYQQLVSDSAAGIIDSLIIPLEIANEDRFQEVLSLIRLMKFEQAHGLLVNHLTNVDDPWFVWLLIQKARIEFELGRIEQFSATMDFISPLYSALDLFQQFEYLHLTAKKKALEGDYDKQQEVLNYLLKAQRRDRTSIILNELGESLLSTKRFNQLLELFQFHPDANYRFKCAIIDALKATDKVQEAKVLMKKIHLEYPYSKRVFLSFLLLEM